MLHLLRLSICLSSTLQHFLLLDLALQLDALLLLPQLLLAVMLLCWGDHAGHFFRVALDLLQQVAEALYCGRGEVFRLCRTLTEGIHLPGTHQSSFSHDLAGRCWIALVDLAQQQPCFANLNACIHTFCLALPVKDIRLDSLLPKKP